MSLPSSLPVLPIFSNLSAVAAASWRCSVRISAISSFGVYFRWDLFSLSIVDEKERRRVKWGPSPKF